MFLCNLVAHNQHYPLYDNLFPFVETCFSGSMAVSFTLTAEQIIALAPDAASASAGKKLAAPRTWQNLGQNDAALWGECQGSGKDPYQVRVALDSMTTTCSCPSRKFPCKHGLGLLLMAASAAPPPMSEPPEWVASWLAKRTATAEKRQERAEKAAAAPARDPAAPPTAAQQKRAAKKNARTADGLAALDLWMNDLMRAGLVSLESQSTQVWEHQARRLVDAQARGLAGYIRNTGPVVGATPNWQARLLDRLGRAAVLTQAYTHLDDLAPALQDDLRQIIDPGLRTEDVLARGEAVTDDWLILGQIVVQDDERPQVRYQRTWLLGRATDRAAQIQQTSAMGAPFPETLIPSSRLIGTLRFWPGAAPLRALVEARQATAPDFPAEPLPGAPTIAAFLQRMADLLALQPWQVGRRLAVLRDVVPLCAANGAHWWARDQAGDALPLADGEHWKLLALSGGQPVDLAAEWDGERLHPLGARAGAIYHLLGGVQ